MNVAAEAAEHVYQLKRRKNLLVIALLRPARILKVGRTFQTAQSFIAAHAGRAAEQPTAILPFSFLLRISTTTSFPRRIRDIIIAGTILLFLLLLPQLLPFIPGVALEIEPNIV